MIFYDSLIASNTIVFLAVCAFLFYLYWYGRKTKNAIKVIYNTLEELLGRTALRIVAETDSIVTNKFIVAEFDGSYYIQQLKILLISDSSGWVIRITAVSDIRIPFTMTMQQVRVMEPLTKLSNDELHAYFRKTFVINCSDRTLYEKYLYKENIVRLLKNISLFSKFRINTIKSNNGGTLFEIYIKKIALSSVLSAIALFESLLQLEAFGSRDKIISNKDKERLIFKVDSL